MTDYATWELMLAIVAAGFLLAVGEYLFDLLYAWAQQLRRRG